MTKVIKGVEQLSCEERLRELGQLGEEKAWRNLIHVYKYLPEKQIRIRLFSLVISGNAKDGGHKLKFEKFRKNKKSAIRMAEL